MALTKVGSDFLTKEAVDTKLPTYLRRLFTRYARTAEHPLRWARTSRIARSVGRGSATTGKKLYSGVTKGVQAYGNALYHHPKTMVPLTGALAYGAVNIPNNLRNNIRYSNPNDNSVYMTSPALFRGTPYQVNSPIPLKSIQGYPNMKGR